MLTYACRYDEVIIFEPFDDMGIIYEYIFADVINERYETKRRLQTNRKLRRNTQKGNNGIITVPSNGMAHRAQEPGGGPPPRKQETLHRLKYAAEIKVATLNVRGLCAAGKRQ